jgi:hypothetical protein
MKTISAMVDAVPGRPPKPARLDKRFPPAKWIDGENG